ncbi:membrane protein [Bacteroidia bacterium]|nr:membrane protein [Bacteroidia bacterium]
MSFLYPAVLWGLCAVSIPIIVHLFHFQKLRKTYFSNVALLREITYKEQRRSRLKQWIILILRILIIIGLVLAFAQPYSKKRTYNIPQTGLHYVSLFVDNSFSMQTSDDGEILLEQAKTLATHLVKQYKPSDKFHILTQDFSSDYQRFVSQEEAIAHISELQMCPFSYRLSDILQRQTRMFTDILDNFHTLHYISDFQKNTMDDVPETFVTDSLCRSFFHWIGGTQNDNLTIDSIVMDAPVVEVNTTATVRVSVTNHSAQSIEKVAIRLWIGQQQVAFSSVDIRSNETKLVDIPFRLTSTGVIQGFAELTDYPVQFDDRFYFTLQAVSKIPVLLVFDDKINPYIEKLFARNTSIELHSTQLKSLDYARLKTTSLVVLDHLHNLPTGLQYELQNAMNEGAHALLLPSQKLDLANINLFLQAVSGLQLDSLSNTPTTLSEGLFADKLFRNTFQKIPKNVELPTIFKHYPIRMDAHSKAVPILKNKDLSVFLCRTPHGKGALYLLSVPIDSSYSNFQDQPLFVVSLLNMALQNSLQNQMQTFISANETAEVTLNTVDLVGINERLIISSEADKTFEVIPNIRRQGRTVLLSTFGTIRQAGNYALSAQNTYLSGISYNYDRKESNLTCLSQTELRRWLKEHNVSMATVLLSKTDGSLNAQPESPLAQSTLWQFLIGFCLLCLLAEIALLRFWK